MTNNPADAFDPMRFALQCIRSICKDSPRNGQTWHDIDEIAANALSAAKTDRDGAEDTARLDWLDQVNTRTNDRVGTSYGWKFDINHNRAALTDHNLPALHVRAAIDEARLKSAPVKQEGQMG